MPITLSLSADFDNAVDDLETVTLKDRAGSTLDTITTGAKRLALNTRKAEASNGMYRKGDTVWHLQADDVSSAPSMGQKITDSASDTYTILGVDRIVFDTRYRCITRNLSIEKRLDTLVTIQQAAFSAGAGGDAQATWSDWKPNIRARIQPITASVDEELGARRKDTTYEIYTENQYPDIGTGHRVVDRDGTIYKVRGFKMPERIDSLFTIEANKVPWPFA